VGELGWVCPIDPVEGETELIAQVVGDFQRYTPLATFIL
jgi:hypothetical protein